MTNCMSGMLSSHREKKNIAINNDEHALLTNLSDQAPIESSNTAQSFFEHQYEYYIALDQEIAPSKFGNLFGRNSKKNTQKVLNLSLYVKNPLIETSKKIDKADFNANFSAFFLTENDKLETRKSELIDPVYTHASVQLSSNNNNSEQAAYFEIPNRSGTNLLFQAEHTPDHTIKLFQRNQLLLTLHEDTGIKFHLPILNKKYIDALYAKSDLNTSETESPSHTCTSSSIYTSSEESISTETIPEYCYHTIMETDKRENNKEYGGLEDRSETSSSCSTSFDENNFLDSAINTDNPLSTQKSMVQQYESRLQPATQGPYEIAFHKFKHPHEDNFTKTQPLLVRKAVELLHHDVFPIFFKKDFEDTSHNMRFLAQLLFFKQLPAKPGEPSPLIYERPAVGAYNLSPYQYIAVHLANGARIWIENPIKNDNEQLYYWFTPDQTISLIYKKNYNNENCKRIFSITKENGKKNLYLESPMVKTDLTQSPFKQETQSQFKQKTKTEHNKKNSYQEASIRKLYKGSLPEQKTKYSLRDMSKKMSSRSLFSD